MELLSDLIYFALVFWFAFSAIKILTQKKRIEKLEWDVASKESWVRSYEREVDEFRKLDADYSRRLTAALNDLNSLREEYDKLSANFTSELESVATRLYPVVTVADPQPAVKPKTKKKAKKPAKSKKKGA